MIIPRRASIATRSTLRNEAGHPRLPIETSGKLTPALASVVEVCADAVQQCGLPRSLGQIFGVLYVSPEPLTFGDIVERLGLSKGSISQGIRVLRDFGAIRCVSAKGARPEYFEPETELRRFLAQLLRARVQAPLQESMDRLKAIRRELDRAPEAERVFIEQRVASLQAWHRHALFALPLLQRFLGRAQS